MQALKRTLRVTVALALTLAGARAAQAAVVFTCSVTASGISFGTYNPVNTGGSAAVGSFLVTCTATGSGTANVAGTLSLSTGASGMFATRTMKSGVNALAYNIYLTPAYQQILGDGTAGTYQVSASGTVSAGQMYQVGGNFYGFLPGSQDVPPGNYADTIVVTVNY